MADSEMCLNAARAVYPNDEDLRVAYMLGFNDGYERRESEQPSLPEGLEEEIERVCAEIEEKNPQHRGLKPSGIAKIARHFYYRGLIEKGLALEAPEGMYKNE